MKTVSKIFIAILFLTASSKSFSQTAEEMQAWMAYMTPGAVHEMLAKSDGTWTGEITMWMDPSAPPQTMTSTAVNKMILGGRYQQSTYTGTMMGMPFEGMSITGYDNAKKVFVNSWVDNIGTGMMNLSGPWDEASKSILLSGTMTDPSGKDLPVREVFKIVDDNNQVMEMYYTIDGKEMKTMEIKYKRN